MFARDCCNHSPLSNEKLRNEILRETKECHDKMFGVLSLTLRDNNDYMWEHYGGQHQGFCVGYNTAKLTESGYFGSGGFVNYSDKLPYIDFVNDDTATKFVKNTFYKKTVPYSQEEEYRLAKRWDHEVTDTERVATIPIDCVVQIVIGRNAPDHIREAIREIKQKMYPNAKFLEL